MRTETKRIPKLVWPRRATNVESDVVDVTKLSGQQIGQARSNIRTRVRLASGEIVTGLALVGGATVATIATGGLASPLLIPALVPLAHGLYERGHLWRRGINKTLKDGSIEEAAQRYYTERNPKIAIKKQEEARQILAQTEMATTTARDTVSTIKGHRTELITRRGAGEESDKTAWLARESTAAKLSAAETAVAKAETAEAGPRQALEKRHQITTTAQQADTALARGRWQRPQKTSRQK